MRAVDCRVEGGGGLVHQQHFRVGRQGPGDAQPLLLAAGQVQGRDVQPVLDLVPQGRCVAGSARPRASSRAGDR